MEGYHGVVLRINLTKGAIAKEPLKEELIYDFAGGRGFNSKVLYDEVKPGIDPLGPDNKVIIGIGPCNGTLVPGSQRFTITSKSPLTGFLGDANCGGSFGAELKYAGYDMVIIEGQAQEPTYIWIDDDHVTLKPATHLWGKTTRETMRAIEREVGDPNISIAAIGPAGEAIVKFACIISDLGRAAGRSGQGAVWGSKNLKAMAVRGTKGVKVADLKMLEEAVKETYDGWSRDPVYTNNKVVWGPAMGWKRYEKFGMFATNNFRGGTFPTPLVGGLLGLEKFYVTPKACFSCPLPCDHMFVVREGSYAGTYGQGMQLTVPLDFGPRIGNSDSALALKAAQLCDDYGVDYFDMAGLIAYASECFEKGILTVKDTGGLRLHWGSKDILELIEMTTYRKGIGAILAEGIKRASQTIGKGSEKFAMHVKSQSIPPRDVRASKGWGLAFAVASRGGCHTRADLPEGYPPEAVDSRLAEVFKRYKDATSPCSENGKAAMVKWYEDMRAFENCLEICYYSIYPWMFSSGSVLGILSKFFNSVTGLNITEDEVLRIGERITNIERLFNIREGLTRKDDSLPDRMTNEPMPDGPAKGEVVRLDRMLDEYYELRGWDSDGFPTNEKLSELGVENG
jgi:aldehyde:ferredoxin oxidoreductase